MENRNMLQLIHLTQGITDYLKQKLSIGIVNKILKTPSF